MAIGPGRIYEAACALSFDNNLFPIIDKTYIVSPFSSRHIEPIFKKFGINQPIEFVSDSDLINSYNLHAWSQDTWYLQQALKLSLLDSLPDDKFLIQDCDVFAIRHYEYFRNNVPNFRVEDVWNDHHKIYEEYIYKLTGIKRPLPLSFVTEFMPLRKDDWIFCKKQILDHTGLPWYEAVPKLETFNELKWFSEYELLGFLVTSRDSDYTYEFDLHPIIDSWDNFYNASWDNVSTVKFKARPLKCMNEHEAQAVVDYFKSKDFSASCNT